MASPQKENGYTPIANELVDHLCYPGINGSQYRILLFVIRKTYGFHKKMDIISLSQFEIGTKMNRAQVVDTVKELVCKRILVKVENRYQFNKNWEEWVVCKRVPQEQSIKYKWPRKCSVCGFSGVLEKHHIVPRNKGGTNNYENLIVLCPNHHALADSGQISVDQLYKLRQKSVEELGGSMQNEKGSMQKHTQGSMQKHTHKRKLKDTYTKDTVAADAAPQSLEEFLQSVRASKLRYINLIGEYADTKKLNYTTKGQWQMFIKRNVRAAKMLEPYTDKQIGTAYGEMTADRNRMVKEGKNYKWGMETLIKYLES